MSREAPHALVHSQGMRGGHYALLGGAQAGQALVGGNAGELLRPVTSCDQVDLGRSFASSKIAMALLYVNACASAVPGSAGWALLTSRDTHA